MATQTWHIDWHAKACNLLDCIATPEVINNLILSEENESENMIKAAAFQEPTNVVNACKEALH